MPYFPQLTTGAVAQYPVARRAIEHTILRESPGGHQVRLASPGAAATGWTLRFTALSAAEASALEQFFQDREGRLLPFTFLDPAANLLAHSEDPGQNVWIKGPTIALTPSVSDPFGTNRATRIVNTGATTQTIAQDVAGPGTYHYCLSVWIRSSQAGAITLRRSAGASLATKLVAPSAEWRRVHHSATLEAADAPVRFAIELPPSAVVDVFGAQVEAQPAPGDYLSAGARSGVYPDAFFAQDELQVTATAFQQFAATVSIVHWRGV